MYAAVVLAGGRGDRLGGDGKPAEEVGGVPMLDRVVTACAAATSVVVVGPQRPVCREVSWTRERPAGAGPVPALRAGLEAVGAPLLAVLAADLPFLRPYDLELLCAMAQPPAAGALLVDGGGRAQWLAGVWRAEPLRSVLAGYSGGSLGGLLGPLRPRPLAVLGGGRPKPWWDCDTPSELALARRLG